MSDKVNISETIEGCVSSLMKRAGVGSVLLGISGGADSTALLLALLEARVKVRCIHCNFHLRGEESIRDQRHVETLCLRHDVPLEIVHFETIGYASSHNVSIEMACRDLRYGVFREIMKRENLQRIAVAHNSDDNAETLLLNLFRGAGVKGLRGMKVDTGEIIRPLLSVSRREIEEYLKEKDETFVTDSTNLDSEYKRNFIRNRLLPEIESRWPGIRTTLSRVMENMAMEEKALDVFEENLLSGVGNLLDWEKIEESKCQEWIIRRFCRRHNADEKLIKEISGVYSRDGKKAKGKKWFVGNGRLIFGRDGLYFLKDRDNGKAVSERDIRLDFDVAVLENTVAARSEMKNSPNTTLYLPYSPVNVEFRRFRAGDRMKPLGMKGSKLVSDIIKDAGLSPEEKENLVIVQNIESGEILWVEGLRRSRIDLIEDDGKAFYRISRKIL